MTTGTLLKSLLDIAGLRQKSFADRMFTSPSKLSKLINGNILLSRKEANDFSERAARILANEIYEPNCYYKLQDLFPFIVNFSSRNELYQFLLAAFSYTINLDLESADVAVSDRTKTDLHCSGPKQCKYMFCIICSDYLTREILEEYEFFSSLPRYSDRFIECFEDIVPLIPAGKYKMSMQQFFYLHGKNTARVGYGEDIVAKIFEEEEYSDLYFWKLDFESSNHFFMLKNQFILLFNEYVDGTPQISLLRNRAQLDRYTAFVDSAMERASRRSFNQNNVSDFLNQSADENEEVRSKMRVISELAQIIDSTDFPDPLHFFNNLLKNDAALFITSDALADFLFSRNIAEQLLKIEGISLGKRIKYVKNFYKYLDKQKDKRINIIESHVFSLVIICQGNYSLICLINVAKNILKYHIVHTEAIAGEMTKWAALSAIDSSQYIKTLMRQVRDQ
ncbi:MAG: helix-turn-helix transcriptional regulator [Clostridiaceae bacterium]|jgi:transcriptional regulator with XRE-family HTH domain|nr:helix-turn-helix transcriptional regulator [Clostridiaceae bacterium]